MATTGLVVHVVGPPAEALSRILQRHLGSLASVRAWDALPPPHAIDADDVIVIDLTEYVPAAAPARMASMTESTVVLLVGDGPIQSAWLSVLTGARGRPIRVIQQGSPGLMGGCASLVSWLSGWLRGLGGDELTRLVLEHEPCLSPCRSLVEAICRDPCAVRRPSDLANAARIGHRLLRQLCHGLGFTRTEHLIMAVRFIGLEVLVERGVPLALARRQMGISNPANARRQLLRARRRSPRAFRKLRLLSA